MNPIQRKRRAKLVAKLAIDGTIAAFALFVAFYLRYEGAIIPFHMRQMTWLIPAVVVGKGAINYALGSYREIWQYTSLRVVRVQVIGSSVAAVILGLLRITSLLAIPYSVVVIDWALYVLGTAGVRALRRLQIQRQYGTKRLRGEEDAIPVLFVGAGDTARALIGELEAHGSRTWNVVGLLDDDLSKHGRTIMGLPILGPTTDLARTIRARDIRHVVIAMPSAERAVVRELIASARRSGATVQVMPAVRDMIGRNRATTGNPKVTLADLMDSKEVSRALLPAASSAHRDSTILVTGGAGYIGSHLVRKLLAAGYRVRVLDNFLNGDHGLAEIRNHRQLEVIEGDISSVRDVVASVKDVGTVIALAAIVGDPACGVDAEETLNLNYESTKILVEACNFYGVRRLVFASSCSVYGASDEELLTESSSLNPVSLYARTRIMSENVIFEQSDEVVPVVLRLATVFGYSPRMRFDLVVNTLTVHAVVEGRLRITGGEQWRPFVHCQDAAEAFKLAATADDDRVRNKIFNVGSESMNYTISDIGRLVENEVPGVQIETSDLVDDPRNYRVGFERIRRALGFKPAHDVRLGIREMVREIRRNDVLKDYNNGMYSNVKVMTSRVEEAASIPDLSALTRPLAPERAAAVGDHVVPVAAQRRSSSHPVG